MLLTSRTSPALALFTVRGLGRGFGAGGGVAFFDPVESALASAEAPSPGSYKKIKNSLITIINFDKSYNTFAVACFRETPLSTLASS